MIGSTSASIQVQMTKRPDNKGPPGANHEFTINDEAKMCKKPSKLQ